MVTWQSSEALAERRREAGARVPHPGFSDTRDPWACGPGDTSCLPVLRHVHPQSFSPPRPFQEGRPDGCPQSHMDKARPRQGRALPKVTRWRPAASRSRHRDSASPHLTKPSVCLIAQQLQPPGLR